MHGLADAAKVDGPLGEALGVSETHATSPRATGNEAPARETTEHLAGDDLLHTGLGTAAGSLAFDCTDRPIQRALHDVAGELAGLGFKSSHTTPPWTS